jgi:ribonucleoside-diphosphate reductase alpha chain
MLCGTSASTSDLLTSLPRRKRLDKARERLPRTRKAQTRSFRLYNDTGGLLEGYLITGEYPDGRLGEVFVNVSKQGSTMGGVLDAFSIVFSIALQYGVPPEVMLDHLRDMYFEPFGNTDDPEIEKVRSIMDYLARRLSLDYLKGDKSAQRSLEKGKETA